MTDPIISVRDLVKVYGQRRLPGPLRKRGFPALRGTTLEVERGSVFGLLGPNGAGKTTLIKILLGLVRATDGEASLFGLPAGHPGARRKVGYLPEAHRMPAYLTCWLALDASSARNGGLQVLPGSHGWGSLLPCKQLKPGGQGEHSAWFTTALKLPGGQLMAAAEPSGQKVPVAQGLGTDVAPGHL